jgi:RNA polymerase sigma factor (sigma-70 family)
MFNDSLHFQGLFDDAPVAHDMPEQFQQHSDDEPADEAVVPQAREAPEAADFGNLMTLYLQDVRRYPALNAAQEGALLARMAQGDTMARQDLICHHLGLVIAMARRFNQRGLPLLDLIEEGNLALLVALDKFDTSRGLRFSTYAGWWIRYFLQTAVATQVPIVRPPLRAQKRARTGAWSQWQALHGVESVDAASADANVAEAAALHPAVVPVPMHDADTESQLINAGHVGGDACEAVSALRDGPRLDALLHELVAALPPRQRDLLVARFGLDGQDGLSLADLGKCSGVSRERMRQVQVQALEALREALAQAGITRDAAMD